MSSWDKCPICHGPPVAITSYADRYVYECHSIHRWWTPDVLLPMNLR